METLLAIGMLLALASFVAIPFVRGEEEIQLPQRDQDSVEESDSTVWASEEEWAENEMPGAVVLPEARSEIDLSAGLSYIYDSNRSRRPGGSGGSLALFDFGFNFVSGRESKRGMFYGLGYRGLLYSYEDTAFQSSTNTLDHNVNGVAGLNGAKTRIRLNGSYSHDGGDLVDFDQADREVRNAASNDYRFKIGVVRDLPHGSLEFGSGFGHRDFENDSLLSDSSQPYSDYAWYYKPGFAPKTQVGLGLKIGKDDYQGQPEQTYKTPSLRWRYRLSGKTSLDGSVGYEFRSIDLPGGVDTENPVYRVGVSWDATGKTRFALAIYQEVTPSYTLVGQDYETNGASANLSYKLPKRFRLGASLGVENAKYFGTVAGVNSVRNDDFLRMGVNLTRDLRLLDSVSSDVGLFYNYYETDSNIPTSSFDQHVTGIRFGLAF